MLDLADLKGLRGRVSIDFETTGLDAYRDRSIGLGIYSPDSGVIGFLPTPDDVLSEIASVMATWEKGSWVMAHNLQFELAYIRPDQELLDHLRWYDTQVAEHLLREDGALDLGACEVRHFGTHTKRGYLEQSKAWGGIKNVAKWPLSAVAEYCINDCRLTDALAQDQALELRRQRLGSLMRTSMEYVLNLHRIEHHGVAIDRRALAAFKRRMSRLKTDGEERLHSSLREQGLEPINYRSASQVHKLVYKDLKQPWPEMPPELAGSPKALKYNSTRTAQEFLDQMTHPTVRLLAQLKKVGTIASYVKSYEKLGLVEDDLLILHPHFNPTGTVTGRLSSSKPNLQQVSDKEVGAELSADGEGLRLRTIFTARPGRYLVSIDYKQMEVVLFAILSQEPTMISMVRTGEDMHEQVAKLMFKEYDPGRRKVVKTLNFGLLYGLGLAGLAEMLGCGLEEAENLMSLYIGTFPRVRPWMSEVEQQLKQTGFVRYWSGRKRRIRQPRHYYRGVNAVVQGGCADVLMHATNRVSSYLRSTGSGNIVALIHDEMLLELDQRTLNRDITQITRLMAVEDLFGVPFNVDVEVGTHWSVPLSSEEKMNGSPPSAMSCATL